MRRETGWIVGLSTLVLLLAAWATTSTDLPALRGAKPAAGTNRRVPRSPGNGTVDRSEVEPARVPPWLDAVFIILLVVLAAGLIAILVGVNTRRRRRRRALRLGQGDDPDALDGADEALLTARLAQSAEKSLARLREGDPRNAIVRCWLDLEDTVSGIGLSRDPALTSEEFTAEVLTRYAVTPATISDLAALYREARFSEHALGELQRERALEALRSLRDELDRSRAAPSLASAEEIP